jgi:lysozyme
MKTGKAGIDLIKRFEGWRSKAYRDAIGVWTIGYGHTAMAGSPKPVPGMTITKVQGEAILRKDLAKYERAVNNAVTVDLNQNQFDALVSFCFNVGPGNLRKSSVLRRTNECRFDDVPGRLLLWNRAGGKVLTGLTRRRKAEGALFASQAPIDAPLPTPAPEPAENWLTRLIGAIIELIFGRFRK